MAIEDAGVLGNLFSRVSSPAQIAPLLRAYQALRYARASATQASSRLNQKIFHLPDGPAQRERDEQMRAAMRVELGEAADDGSDAGNPNQWADKTKNRIQFGYDADGEVDQWWAENGARVEALAQAQAKL
jgi:salicylate hydroxylase